MIYQVGLNCELVVRNKKTMVLSDAQHRCPCHEIITKYSDIHFNRICTFKAVII